MWCKACGKRPRIPDDFLCYECEREYMERCYLDCPVDTTGREFIGPINPGNWASMKEWQRAVASGNMSQEAYDERIRNMVRRNNPEGFSAEYIYAERKRRNSQCWWPRPNKSGISLPKRAYEQKYVGIDPRK